MSKRIVMTLAEIREQSYLPPEEAAEAGICELVEVENMGWCRDGVTRWYHFINEDGQPAVYYRR